MFNSSFIEIEGFEIPFEDRFPYTDFNYKCLVKCVEQFAVLLRSKECVATATPIIP